jgi:hypothetical protein
MLQLSRYHTSDHASYSFTAGIAYTRGHRRHVPAVCRKRHLKGVKIFLKSVVIAIRVHTRHAAEENLAELKCVIAEASKEDNTVDSFVKHDSEFAGQDDSTTRKISSKRHHVIPAVASKAVAKLPFPRWPYDI